MNYSRKTTITQQMWDLGQEYAMSGDSKSVILNKLKIDEVWFDEKVEKSSRTHLDFSNMIYNYSLEYWENVGRDNIGKRGFNSSTYNFMMKKRFPNHYGDEQKATEKIDDRPIQIVFGGQATKSIHSEKELLEREKISLNDLFDNSNTKEMTFDDE